jgi:hypothetical protein
MDDRGPILKVQGTEVAVNTSVANTVGGASFVRVLNRDAGYVLVTQQRLAANLANVSCTVAPGRELLLAKAPSDTITSNSAASVVAVGVKFF